ncbi:MAG: hypothetical protein A3F17_04805 [Gammaproteobacteria bacterium RIFCSPHIGHO2_12_FULL_41_15]|nr:MAG: hypothetical protein A3F17_04805 [Gammaproteobacteria bacterium RIFCSPHIGHO2_12_FULL_41_15]
MSTPLDRTDLILNNDGSIYHLHLLPEELAPIVFLVSDSDRVSLVSKLFDFIEVCKENREFVTHTGQMGGHRVSAISTGIGTGSVDIVINELDALANINFKSRLPRKQFRQLTIIRLGTTDTLFKEIKPDDLLISQFAIGLDGLANFYSFRPNARERSLQRAVRNFISDKDYEGGVFAAQADNHLLSLLSPIGMQSISLTCPGFYAPQQRELRITLQQPKWFSQLQKFSYRGTRIVNREMETASLYMLSRFYGHAACSVSCVMLNRYTNKMSKDPIMAIENMIEKTLDTFLQGYCSV